MGGTPLLVARCDYSRGRLSNATEFPIYREFCCSGITLVKFFGYEPVFAKLPCNQNLEVKLASCIYELEVTICSPCETFHCRSHRNSCGSQNLPPQLPWGVNAFGFSKLRASIYHRDNIRRQRIAQTCHRFATFKTNNLGNKEDRFRHPDTFSMRACAQKL